MKRKVCVTVLMGVSSTCAGIALAAEPMQLSDAQLDLVSAGGLYSKVSGMAAASSGKTYVVATTSASTTGGVKRTQSSVVSVAVRSSK